MWTDTSELSLSVSPFCSWPCFPFFPITKHPFMSYKHHHGANTHLFLFPFHEIFVLVSNCLQVILNSDMLSLALKMSQGLESDSWFGLYHSLIQKKLLGVCYVPGVVQTWRIHAIRQCLRLTDLMWRPSQQAPADHRTVKGTRIRVTAWFFEGIYSNLGLPRWLSG